MKKLKSLSLLAIGFVTVMLSAQNVRNTYTINSDWQFHKGDVSTQVSSENNNDWESVSIPHTWNAEDAFDDTPDYYRDMGVYKKSIFFSEKDKNKSIQIYFEGANQETEVFVNGTSVGLHIGGYTAFSFAITEQINFGKANDIVVKVTNKFNEDIPTLTGDFTFFGGIYRDVYIQKMNPVHFEDGHYTAKNVLISTPKVTKENASILFKGQVTNETASKIEIEVVQSVRNAGKQVVKEIKTAYRLKSNETIAFEQNISEFKNPNLWSPDNPYLYEVITKIVDIKTKKF
ncbi:sugar-binding domain-containing protein [Formosa haliotis]|uniref:sugar-binding domain-containing protein n=1 Tax=Formosa haliotis TaxID=1555194 RepID=UPI0009F632B2|nr:sugar-binding domain-containing protein [Formosa haliotis]